MLASVVLASAALVFAGYALAARFAIHGPVTGRSLFESVEEESGSTGRMLEDRNRCRAATRAAQWSCDVMDTEGSGGASYRVRVRAGSSCWDGRLVKDYSEAGMPRAIGGCVHRWQWTLLGLV